MMLLRAAPPGGPGTRTRARAGEAMPMLTHDSDPERIDHVVSLIRDRITAAGDKPHVTVDEQLDLLAQLADFPLGRFMLVHRGWNGYWTRQAVVYHAQTGRSRGADEFERPYTPLEARLLDLPLCRATQERFAHFRRLLQAQVREGVRMGSLPCGLMDDLLGLDFSGVSTFTLVGIDLDADSLRQAALEAEHRGLIGHASFLREDGWDRGDDGLDVLTSSGLNIYEPDDERIIALYRAFRHRMTRGGTLVTSVLTPSDEHDASQIDEDSQRLERIIFGDLVGVRFSARRSVALTTDQLAQARFEVTEVVYDRAHMFPTVVARRL